MMKKMKRFVAVLLTGVMALTMLTACGSGKFIERNAKLEGAYSLLMEVLAKTTGESATIENDAIDSIIEKYAREISKKPGEYIAAYAAHVASDDEEAAKLYSELQDKLTSECAAAIGKESLNAAMIISDGTQSVDEQIKAVVEALLASVTPTNDAKITVSYCVRVYHVTNPAKSSDSAWVAFLVVNRGE